MRKVSYPTIFVKFYMFDWSFSWSSADGNEDPLEAAKDSIFIKILLKLMQEGLIDLIHFVHFTVVSHCFWDMGQSMCICWTYKGHWNNLKLEILMKMNKWIKNAF